MRIKKILNCLLIAFTCLATSLPSQATMVSTAQMQVDQVTIDLGNVAQQREWIRAQLINGGVDKANAVQRVAAMTDAQVIQIHQRIDQEPAGGNAVVWVLVILLISELAGWTDIIPAIRPLD